MKTLIFGLLLASVAFSGCSRSKKSTRSTIGPGHQDNQNQDQSPRPDGSYPTAVCEYRYEKSNQSQQWEALSKFIGIWISKSSELTERRDGETVVYTKEGINVESEISFRPLVFVYSDSEGKNLIGIDAEPAHSLKMSGDTFDGYYILQTFHDLRPKLEKCQTFAIQLLKGDNVLEVLGPEFGDSRSEPKSVTDFFEGSPKTQRFEIYESRWQHD